MGISKVCGFRNLIICLDPVRSQFLDCPILKANTNQAAASACKPEMNIVDESVGFTSPLQVLPGCNLVWSGTGPKPACNPNPPIPGFVSPKTPLPSGWYELGCIAEGTQGRAFTGSSTTNDAMTKAVCANYCSGLGFPYAGVEYSRECYCGKGFSNGAVNTTVAWSDCSNTCSGNSRSVYSSNFTVADDHTYRKRELRRTKQTYPVVQPELSLNNGW